MIVSIDTNVIVYIVSGNKQFGEKALKIFKKHSFRAAFVICPIIYAELSAFFEDKNLLDLFITDNNINLITPSGKALYLAGEKWAEYNKKRKFICPECGVKLKITICRNCKKQVPLKQHIISDFIIGAFSKVQADKLFTFDKGIYKTYFPDLKLL